VEKEDSSTELTGKIEEIKTNKETEVDSNKTVEIATVVIEIVLTVKTQLGKVPLKLLPIKQMFS